MSNKPAAGGDAKGRKAKAKTNVRTKEGKEKDNAMEENVGERGAYF